MKAENKNHRDPFKGLAFPGKPVSKSEYIEAYESYVSRCSMITNDNHEKTMDEKLAELKKKHPQKNLRLLQLDDPDLNISLMMRSRLCLVLINNVPYHGILVTKVEHSWEYPPHLRVQMIVDAGEFGTSTNKARGIISQYEKHSNHHRKHDESGI